MAVGLHRPCGMAALYAVELLSGKNTPFPAWCGNVSGPSTCFHVTVLRVGVDGRGKRCPHWHRGLTVRGTSDSKCRGAHRQAIVTVDAASGSPFACSCIIISYQID